MVVKICHLEPSGALWSHLAGLPIGSLRGGWGPARIHIWYHVLVSGRAYIYMDFTSNMHTSEHWHDCSRGRNWVYVLVEPGPLPTHRPKSSHVHIYIISILCIYIHVYSRELELNIPSGGFFKDACGAFHAQSMRRKLIQD